MKYLISSIALALLISLNANAQKREKSIDAKKRSIFSKEVKTFDQNEIPRTYTVYTPKGVGKNELLPTVFLLHGGGGNMNNFANKVKWFDLPDKIILVFLQAANICIEKDGEQSFGNYFLNNRKASQLCPGSIRYNEIDYLDIVVDDLKTNYPVDTNQFFATGFSNGCGMILQSILVEKPNMFKAYAGVGSLPQIDYYQGIQADVALYLSIGQKDDVMLKHSSQDKFIYSYESFTKEPIFSNTINYLSAFMQLDTAYQKNDGDGTLRLIYANGPSPKSLLILELMEHLKHLYPAGKKQHNNIKMAERQWYFFKNYEKLKRKYK